MPISSGFGYYPYNYPTTIRIEQPIRILKETQTKSTGVPFQQRSDTFTIPKRDTKSLPPYTLPKIKQSLADSKSKQQKTTRPTTAVVRNKPTNNSNNQTKSSLTSLTPKNKPNVLQKQTKVVAHELKKDNTKNSDVNYTHKTILKHNSISNNEQRKPVRFSDQLVEYNRTPDDDDHVTYLDPPPSKVSPPPVRRQYNSRQIYRTDSDSDNESSRKPRRTFIVQQPSVKRNERRLVRNNDQFIHEPDSYYVDSNQSSRPTKVVYINNQNRSVPHRSRPKYVYMNENSPHQSDVVYVDEPPGVQYVTAPTTNRRYRTPSRPAYHEEVIYVDDDEQPVEYVEYVDEQPVEYVEYVYENEPIVPKSSRSNIVYVEESQPSRYYQKHQPSGTNVVYQ
ncbi:unnamed protein product [Didymodactylos carnosus]|uniref:Uncharacterized protein n=1 Tax=Didymodactylos carnosus TaxID=1234261 RepID=A0A815AHX8_9BILA|nr:unnamed protein product [Didymodactylos carnosus]CAF1256104.1 unnamed protein product [Didymodactylos carnosus]CAF3838286.1 unnamed protein product [Didymodactylos carnosus]CAF4029106.1 unnamed protein product [Didymodactylos carnosus]